MATKNPPTIPTLKDLIIDTEMSLKENALMILCNQEPPPQWLAYHPTAKIKVNGKDEPLPYLPIARVEYLLTRIFGGWWVEVKNIQFTASSVVVTVRLYVINPVTDEEEWSDGVGASPIGRSDVGVQLAVPAAESFAIKDAAEKFGKLFGKDLTRKDAISYDSLLKVRPEYEELKEEYENKKEKISPEEQIHFERILNNREVSSYDKLRNELLKIKI